jgi:formylglycine-generating enzyme
MAGRKTADHRWKVFTGSIPSAGQSAATPSASAGPRKPGDPPKSARPGIPPSTSKQPPSLGVPGRAPGVKVSSPASVFEKLLRSFETGGFTYAYVLADLKRLLEANASPTQLLEVLARRQSIEPLPQDAYIEIFAVLDDAAARVAAEGASAGEAASADADTPPVKIPETAPTPIEPAPPAPRTRPNIAQAKSTQVALRSVFERVLSVFETSGFTDFEVLSQLKRLLLATGASPTMLLEALRRRQLFEPLPEHAHAQVLGLLHEVLGQTEAPIQVVDMAGQAQDPFITPDAIPAGPRSRSPAEVSTPAVTATKSAPPDSALAKPTVTPPANRQLRFWTPPPVAPSSTSTKPEPTQPAPEKTAAPTAPLAPDSVLTKPAAPPPADGQLKVSTPPPVAPSSALSKPDSAPPASEKTVAPTAPPDSLPTKPVATPPADGQLKVSTPPPVAPSPALSKPDSTPPASEKTVAPTAPPLAPDSVLTKSAATPPANEQLKVSTPPPVAPSSASSKQESAQPASEESAGPSAPPLAPDSVLTKSAVTPPTNEQLKVWTPPPVAPALSQPDSAPPASEKTAAPTAPPLAPASSRSSPDERPVVSPPPATIPSESAIAKPGVIQPVAAKVAPPASVATSDSAATKKESSEATAQTVTSGATPPANGPLKVSTAPAPVAPSSTSFKQESAQPSSEKTAAPTSPPLTPASSRSSPEERAVASTPATIPSESAIAKPSVTQPVAPQVKPPPSRIVVEELAAPTPTRATPPAAEVAPPAPVATSDESARPQVPALRPVPVPTSRRNQVEMPPPRNATQSTVSGAPAVSASTPSGATQSTNSTAHSAPASTRRTPIEQTAQVNASRMPLPESDAATADASAPAAPQPTAASTPPAAKSPQNLPERRKAAVASARRVLQDWLSGKARNGTRESATTKPGSAATVRASPPPATVSAAPDEEVTIDFDEVARLDSPAELDVAVPWHAPQRAHALQQASTTRTLALKRGKPWKRDSILRATGVGLVAVIVIAAVVSIIGRHELVVPAPVPAPTVAGLPDPGTVIRDCAACPGMTVLPAGRFQQGSAVTDSGSSSFEKPLHWVMINRPLAMSTNAVTVDEFQRFVAATGRDMQGCDTYDGAWKHRPKNSWKSPGFPQSGKHPVTCASWNDAVAYAAWLSLKTGHLYRLPSASEWEYAARAGGAAILPGNPDGSGACENGNVADESAAHRYPGWSVFGCKDGYVYTAPVGSFKSNAFGLNDMLGNVFQWTKDCWSADYVGAPIDGSARTDGNCADHELRGGSWFSTPAYVRANYRNHFAADYRTSSVGIRLVRDFER